MAPLLYCKTLGKRRETAGQFTDLLLPPLAFDEHREAAVLIRVVHRIDREGRRFQ